jgi:hypothetical protein
MLCAMDILHEAPNLLQRYRHGDAFRRYVQRHLPFVAVALIVFLTVSTATTAAMVVFFGGTSEFMVLTCLLLVPFVLVGSLGVQTFIFFSWLEQRALDRVAGRPPCTIQEHLPQVPWTLAAVFIAAPFFILALVSIKVAVTLLLVFILTPVAYSLLDGD